MAMHIGAEERQECGVVGVPVDSFDFADELKEDADIRRALRRIEVRLEIMLEQMHGLMAWADAIREDAER